MMKRFLDTWGILGLRRAAATWEDLLDSFDIGTLDMRKSYAIEARSSKWYE